MEIPTVPVENVQWHNGFNDGLTDGKVDRGDKRRPVIAIPTVDSDNYANGYAYGYCHGYGLELALPPPKNKRGRLSKLSFADRHKVVAAIAAGYRTGVVAKFVNVANATVTYYIDHHGDVPAGHYPGQAAIDAFIAAIPDTRGPGRPVQLPAGECAAMLIAGKRPTEIAAAAGVHVSTVYTVRRRIRAAVRPQLQGRQVKATVTQIKAMLAAGKSKPDIEAELGISRSTLNRILRNEAAHNCGRPRKVTAAIMRRLLAGDNILDIVRDTGIAYTTLYRHRRDSDFDKESILDKESARG